MDTTSIFNITDNRTGDTLELYTHLTQQGTGAYEMMLVETPKEPTADHERQFLRISHHNDSIQICMAINGQVMLENSSLGMVAGFPQSITIDIPDYLLPALKQAINSLK